MAKLKIAVIGLRMGRSHAAGWQACADAEVAVLCDVNREAAEKTAREMGVADFTDDPEAVLARDDVQVVSVVTPDHFHEALVLGALKAGKHVLCEKPMAPAVEACQRMCEAAHRAGKLLMVGQSYRFEPRIRAVKALAEEGAFGRLFYLESHYWNNLRGVGGVGNWRNNPAIRHPFVGGCHALDLLRHIGGEVVEVQAFGNHLALEECPVEDFVSAHLRFESGAVGQAIVSAGCQYPFETTVSLFGSERSLHNGRLFSGKQDREGTPLDVPQKDGGAWANAIHGEIAAFAKAIREQAPAAPISAEDGARTVAACLAVVESVRQGGRAVPVQNERFPLPA